MPKKTKLYVEQTQRERDMAPEIHRRFQRDLCKLRLTTARAYVKTLTDGYMVRQYNLIHIVSSLVYIARLVSITLNLLAVWHSGRLQSR